VNRKIPFMDAYYLMAESRRTPMHVAAMSLLTLPKAVEEVEFLQHIAHLLREDVELRRPFGDKLKTGPLGTAGSMYWERDAELDMDYHVRQSALSKPGSYKELFSLISRLHGSLLDRSRPLWEMYLIEGLQNRQFATYFKVHHSAIDGVGAMQVMNRMYSESARKRVKSSPLSQAAYQQYKAGLPPRPEFPAEKDVRNVFSALQSQIGSAVNVAGAMGTVAEAWRRKGHALSVPFHQIPKMTLTSELTGARRFVAQSWPLERIRTLGKSFGGTINDVVLAMCAGALRRHLEKQGELPRESLKAMTPVSIRSPGDANSSNAIGMVVVDLGTDERDPEKRLRRIKASMDTSKDLLRDMSRKEIEMYSALTHAPHLLTQMLNLASKYPAFNTIISNVPGSKRQRYWHGARVDGVFPLGIPVDGCAINFTMISNHKNLDFGIVACRKSVPQMQRLIDYLEESLLELEMVVAA